LGAPHRRERIWIVAYPSATGTGNYTGAIADERWRTGKSGGEGVRQGNRTGLPSRSIATGQDVADTKGNSNRGVMGNNNEQTRKNWSRTHEHISSSNPRRTSDWWAVEPDVGRLAHGIPHRVDRLKGLGNAIVPQIAELLFRQIAQIEEPPEGGEGKK
jgi:DNA (cytosine-5)-methyltransferase 1